MIEILAAKVEVYTDRLTVFIDKTHADAWLLMRHYLKEKRVSQLHVKLAKVKKPRSTGYRSANSHIHGHATQIAEEVGESKNKIIIDAIDIAMGRIGREFPTHTDYKGDIVPDSESNWDSRTAHHVIESLHQIASMIPVALIEYKDDVKEK